MGYSSNLLLSLAVCGMAGKTRACSKLLALRQINRAGCAGAPDKYHHQIVALSASCGNSVCYNAVSDSE